MPRITSLRMSALVCYSVFLVILVSTNATNAQDAFMASSTVYPWPIIVPPTNFRTMDKVRNFSPAVPVDTWLYPDGKMFAFRSNPKNKTSPFFFSITPDYRMTSTNSFFNNVTGPAGALVKDYPTAIANQHGNYVTLPNNVPIPPKNVTGARGDGTHYDNGDVWLFNAFRLSETSNASAHPDQMIGFVHNEDYWGYPYAVNGCIYKSVGVRYSDDLGLSWTRSVPILTKLVQPETHAECQAQSPDDPPAGTGDMAAMWNPIKSQWVIFAQESQFGGQYRPSPSLVMSVSSDPLARPGTWTRIDPATNRTDPGFIGSMNRTLVHGDLTAILGANPSIIRDAKHNVWHMVYQKWGGGIAYTNSSDLTRWTRPQLLPIDPAEMWTEYPTLIGDEGDTLTTTGRAWLWFKGNDLPGSSGRQMWGTELDFGKSDTAVDVKPLAG